MTTTTPARHIALDIELIAGVNGRPGGAVVDFDGRRYLVAADAPFRETVATLFEQCDHHAANDAAAARGRTAERRAVPSPDAVCEAAMRTLRLATPRWAPCPYHTGPFDVPGFGDLERLGLVYAEQRPANRAGATRWYWSRSDAGNRFLEGIDGVAADRVAPVPATPAMPAAAPPVARLPVGTVEPPAFTSSFDAFMKALRMTPPDWTATERDPGTVPGWPGLAALGLVEAYTVKYDEFFKWRRSDDGNRLLAAVDTAFAAPAPGAAGRTVAGTAADEHRAAAE